MTIISNKRMFRCTKVVCGILVVGCSAVMPVEAVSWETGTAEEWQGHAVSVKGLELSDGVARLQADHGIYRSVVRRFQKKVSATEMLVKQSPEWLNWEPVPAVGPENLKDAPVAVAMGDQDYWLFGRYGGGHLRAKFQAEDTTLEGFDIPLKTTPFQNQYDAPGGLKPPPTDSAMLFPRRKMQFCIVQ